MLAPGADRWIFGLTGRLHCFRGGRTDRRNATSVCKDVRLFGNSRDLFRVEESENSVLGGLAGRGTRCNCPVTLTHRMSRRVAENTYSRRCIMSKKTKTETTRPSVIPIMKSRSKKATGAPTAPPTDGAAKGTTKAAKESKPKKMSCLDAAAKVLADAGSAMTTGEMIEAMAKAKLWSSPNGQTPAATLYSAILREINTKGKAARFKKVDRGQFAYSGNAA